MAEGGRFTAWINLLAFLEVDEPLMTSPAVIDELEGESTRVVATASR
jgi:hypothetical protein